MNRNIDVFNCDAVRNNGYLYTAMDRLSSRMATQRTTDVILGTGRLNGRNVIDMGCGDGFYTIRFWDLAGPESVTGVDGAPGAIEVARRNSGGRPIRFEVGDAHCLPFHDNSFDVALVQSILHHDSEPADIIREAFRLAPEIIIHEPNGNNMGLKFIEKASRYHREHAEKSYSSRQMRAWIEQNGGRISHVRFAGFVAMFCPDWLARMMKAVEPIVEGTPFVKAFACAIYVIVARRALTNAG